MIQADYATHAPQPTLVTCRAVGKAWDTDGAPFVALRDIDLDIARREFVVFLGPSGCGKSTLLYLLAGLEQLTQGQIVCGGAPVNKPVRTVDWSSRKRHCFRG